MTAHRTMNLTRIERPRLLSIPSALLLVAILLAALIAAPGATLQANVSYEEPLSYPFDSVWPSEPGFGSGPFKESVAGRFTGADRMSVFFLHGFVPVFLFEPTSFQSFTAFATSVKDIAVLPYESLGYPLDRDLLFTVGDQGLEFWLFRPSLTQLKVVVDNSPAYSGAQRVVLGDVNGDGLFDAVVLDAGGQSVLVKVQAPGAVWVDPLPQDELGFSLPRDIHEIELVDFDTTTPEPELVMTTEFGLEIRALDGTEVASYPSHQPGADAIGIGTYQGSGVVMWSTKLDSASADSLLYRVDSDGAVFQFGSDRDFVRLGSGDLDGNGIPDVVVTHRDDQELLFLYGFDDGQGLSWIREGDHYLDYSLGTGGGGELPGPRFPAALIADLSKSGDTDLVYPKSAEGTVRVLEGPLYRGGEDPPPGAPDGGGEINLNGPRDFVHNASTYNDDELGQVVSVQLHAILPGLQEILQSDEINRYKIEVRVFDKLEAATTMNPEAIECRMDDMPAALDPTDGSVHIEFAIPDSEGTAYFLYCRVVYLDTDGETILQGGSALLGAIAFAGSGGLDWTRDQIRQSYRWWTWPDFEKLQHENGPGGRLNAHIRLRRLWPTPNGTMF